MFLTMKCIVYVHMHICIYVSHYLGALYIHMYMYICICIHIHIYIYIYIYIHIFEYMFLTMRCMPGALDGQILGEERILGGFPYGFLPECLVRHVRALLRPLYDAHGELLDSNGVDNCVHVDFCVGVRVVYMMPF
jgi:hypothetical protein